MSNAIETAAVAYVRDQLKASGIESDLEWAASVSRTPVRFRQIDLRCTVLGRDVWVEIDGPNHRGVRNKARDRLLSLLAAKHGARLIHWPLWRIVGDGSQPLVDAILDGRTEHLGHAESEPYDVWRSKVYGRPPFTDSSVS